MSASICTPETRPSGIDGLAPPIFAGSSPCLGVGFSITSSINQLAADENDPKRPQCRRPDHFYTWARTQSTMLKDRQRKANVRLQNAAMTCCGVKGGEQT